jgi:hypothetical protein
VIAEVTAVTLLMAFLMLREASSAKILTSMARHVELLTLLMEPWPAIQALASSILVDAIILLPIALMAERMLLVKAVTGLI